MRINGHEWQTLGKKQEKDFVYDGQNDGLNY